MHYPAHMGGGAAVAMLYNSRGPPSAGSGPSIINPPEARANPIDFVISGWHWSTTCRPMMTTVG